MNLLKTFLKFDLFVDSKCAWDSIDICSWEQNLECSVQIAIKTLLLRIFDNVALLKNDILMLAQYCIQGKFRPRFIFALFAHWPEGEFKTGLIQLYLLDYVGKLESGRIQEWANQSRIGIGRK